MGRRSAYRIKIKKNVEKMVVLTNEVPPPPLLATDSEMQRNVGQTWLKCMLTAAITTHESESEVRMPKRQPTLGREPGQKV